MRKQGFGLLFSAMLILTCISCGAKSMAVEAQEAVLNEANAKTNIVDEPVATEPIPESKYTFTDMTAVMYAQNTVNVRNLPSTDGNKLGRLSANTEITVNGQCNETGWYRFDYNGNVAYVSNKYVGMNKVDVRQAPNREGEPSSAGNYNTYYNENATYTIYASDDGLTCVGIDKKTGKKLITAYTIAGLKAYLPIGQIIDNGNGTVKILACGNCISTDEWFGIPSFSVFSVYDIAEKAGYHTYLHDATLNDEESWEWFSNRPDLNHPLNISWYYFSK